MKDFLFFTYSWVDNANYLFESFAKRGHTIDIVTEKTLRSFEPTVAYKNIVLYLHEDWSIPITNKLINEHPLLKDATLIQHDDTDFEDVQVWSDKKPVLVMQRELTAHTKNPWKDVPVEPFHFPMPSLYDASQQQKVYDVCFLGNVTNPKRYGLYQAARQIAERNPQQNWFFKLTQLNTPTDPNEFKRVLNQSKVGLHYFGNSYDAHRIWQTISTNTALLMPFFRNKSVDADHMPFNEYLVLRDDYADLEEKLAYLLEDDRYKVYAAAGLEAYNERHNQEKCFDYYYPKVMEHAKR